MTGDAGKEDLFALHDHLGIERWVIMRSGVHGFDNRVVADAVAARPGRYIGIAPARRDVPDAEIARLSAQGFRGVRYSYMAHLAPGAGPDQLRALADRLAAAGWHWQLDMEAGLIASLAPAPASLPVPVVIDHMGRVDASLGQDQAPFAALLRLMDHDHVWVKVSGSERTPRQDPPYRDATAVARRLLESFPTRVLWGAGWPHPSYRADPPEDGALANL